MKSKYFSLFLLIMIFCLIGCIDSKNLEFYSLNTALLDDAPDLWYRWWDDDAGLYSRYPTSIWGNTEALFMSGTVCWTSGPYYSYLLKWDYGGNRNWYNISSVEALDGNENSEIKDQWGDTGNLYTCGTETDVGLFLIQRDFEGNQTWVRTIDNCSGWGITGDDIYLYTCGEIRSSNPLEQNRSVLVSKWDKLGNIVWNQTFSINISEVYVASVWGDETDLYICCTVQEGLDRDILIIKFTKTGSMEWSKRYGSDLDDNKALSITGDESSIFVGGANNTHGILMKWNLNGELQWSKEEESQSRILDVEVKNGYIYSLGFMRPHLNHLSDVYLAKWDLSGKNIWKRSWGRYDQYELGVSMKITSSHIYSLCYGNLNGVLLKWNFDGQTVFLSKPHSPEIKLHENFIYWNEISGAVQYNIYRNSIPFENTTLLFPYFITDLNSYSFDKEINESFYYAVTAVNGNGESDLSNLIFIEYEHSTISGIPFFSIFIISIISICIIVLQMARKRMKMSE